MSRHSTRLLRAEETEEGIIYAQVTPGVYMVWGIDWAGLHRKSLKAWSEQ